MKVALIELRSKSKDKCVNKDESGTFGTATFAGSSVFNKLISIVKKKGIHLPVLYLPYLSAIFKKYGHDTFFCSNMPKNADLDLVIIASSIVDYKHELEFAKKVKKQIKNAKVGFLGAFATIKPQLFLKHVDFVISGEPEEATIRIAKGKVKKAKLKGVIKGKLIQNLDELPFPDWDTFPIKKYSYYPMLKKKVFLPMLSSRGCPFACNYCPYLVLQMSKWRKRSPKNVVDEIEYLQKKYGMQSTVFRDPVFSLDKDRVREICKEIIARDIKIEWCCETRTDCLDEKLIDIMKKAGMVGINLGVESADTSMLKRATRKPIPNIHQIRIIRYLQKKGVKIAAFYMLGFINDTEESILKTIKFAKILNTTFAQFHIVNAYPGTGFYKKIKDRITAKDWEDFDNYTSIIRLDNIPQKKLMELKEKAFREYYFRLGWLLKNGIKAIF